MNSSPPVSLAAKVRQMRGISTVEMPTDEVDYPGREKIISLFRSTTGYVLPHDLDWSWEAKSGKYKGNLTTRIRKIAYEEFRFSLDPGIVSQIGNVGRSHSLNEAVYYVDFDHSLPWDHGAFGDYVSCFWMSKRATLHALRRIAKDGLLCAMRFWESPADKAFEMSISGYSLRDETRNPRRAYRPQFDMTHVSKQGRFGWGRCWVALDTPATGCALLFNSYPPGLQLTNVARVFTKLMDVQHYHKITLLNHGRWDGNLWINNGVGIFVGDNSVKDNTFIYDLDWDVDDD